MRLTPPSTAGPTFWAALFGIALDGSPWQYMLRLRRQGFDGVARVPLGPAGDFYFLQSPVTVKQVCVDEADAFPRRFSVPLFETLALDRGIVYEQGQRHKQQKRLCIPSFENSRSMASFLEAVQDDSAALAASWRRDCRLAAGARRAESASLPLDLYAEMRRLTLSVVLRVTFGLGAEGAQSYANAAELSSIIGRYLEAIVATANEIPPLWQLSPRLSRNYVAVTEELLPRLRELVAELIAERRRLDGGQGEGSSSDLLSVLIQQPGLKDDDILYILFDLVIAGSDTTASTLTAALFLLHQPEHAEALAAVRAEVDAADLDALTLEQLRGTLPWTTAVARETLRLYPPVPFVGRTSVEDAVVGDCEVPQGGTLCWSPFFLGREPSSWGDDADAFRPQRWVADPITGGAPSTFCWLPFGAGPRGCLGTRLGLTEVVIGCATLLKAFDFKFEREQLRYKYDLTLNLEGSALCEVTPRDTDE